MTTDLEMHTGLPGSLVPDGEACLCSCSLAFPTETEFGFALDRLTSDPRPRDAGEERS